MAVASLIESSGVRILLLVSVLVLMASVAKILLTVLDDNATFDASQIAAPVTSITPPAQKINFANIASWHLFGTAPPKRSPVKKKLIAAPKTRLALKLIGIIHQESPLESFAIIQMNNGEQKKFIVGDKITGNTELTQIGTEAITLRRAGKYESLEMPKADYTELKTQPLSKKR